MSKSTLLAVANRNHGLLQKQVEGITDEQALLAIVDGGSNLSWVLGHLVNSRDDMLMALGAERVRTKEDDDAFKYGTTAPTANNALPFTQQLADYNAAHERLVAAIEAASDDKLAEPYGRNTVQGGLEFGLWHETYHIGQITLYRRLAGLNSPIG